MNWIKTKEQLPPKDARVLVYGQEMGISVADYNYYPAWKPFDEKLFENLPEKIINSMRILNDTNKGESEKHRWACACEDSYWDIDYFTHWAKLPKGPNV